MNETNKPRRSTALVNMVGGLISSGLARIYKDVSLRPHPMALRKLSLARELHHAQLLDFYIESDVRIALSVRPLEPQFRVRTLPSLSSRAGIGQKGLCN